MYLALERDELAALITEPTPRCAIFVHGLGAQLLQFRHPLFDRLGGYRLIALDRPGSGYSVRARGASARLTEQARVIRRFIETLGLEKPLLVGHSLGGMVALATALDHPRAISGIALLAPLTRYQDTLAPIHRGGRRYPPGPPPGGGPPNPARWAWTTSTSRRSGR